MSTQLHDSDLVAWAQHSANLLRQGAELPQDERDQIAEELYDIAKTTRRELRSRAVTLIMHMLKTEYQPERRTRSWDLTIENQRNELTDVLGESPSLNQVIQEELPGIYERARRAAEIETGLNCFPAKNPFTIERILRG